MDNTMAEIRGRIKQRRETLGYSYQALADLTQMSKSTLQRYETGDIRNLPLDKLEVLANALSTTPAWLMGWDAINEERQAARIPLAKIAEEWGVPVEFLKKLSSGALDVELMEKYAKMVTLLKGIPATHKIPMELTAYECFILEQLKKLTPAGQDKVNDYIHDLLQSSVYRSDFSKK